MDILSGDMKKEMTIKLAKECIANGRLDLLKELEDGVIKYNSCDLMAELAELEDTDSTKLVLAIIETENFIYGDYYLLKLLQKLPDVDLEKVANAMSTSKAFFKSLIKYNDVSAELRKYVDVKSLLPYVLKQDTYDNIWRENQNLLLEFLKNDLTDEDKEMISKSTPYVSRLISICKIIGGFPTATKRVRDEISCGVALEDFKTYSFCEGVDRKEVFTAMLKKYNARYPLEHYRSGYLRKEKINQSDRVEFAKAVSKHTNEVEHLACMCEYPELFDYQEMLRSMPQELREDLYYRDIYLKANPDERKLLYAIKCADNILSHTIIHSKLPPEQILEILYQYDGNISHYISFAGKFHKEKKYSPKPERMKEINSQLRRSFRKIPNDYDNFTAFMQKYLSLPGADSDIVMEAIDKRKFNMTESSFIAKSLKDYLSKEQIKLLSENSTYISERACVNFIVNFPDIVDIHDLLIKLISANNRIKSNAYLVYPYLKDKNDRKLLFEFISKKCDMNAKIELAKLCTMEEKQKIAKEVYSQYFDTITGEPLYRNSKHEFAEFLQTTLGMKLEDWIAPQEKEKSLDEQVDDILEILS